MNNEHIISKAHAIKCRITDRLSFFRQGYGQGKLDRLSLSLSLSLSLLQSKCHKVSGFKQKMSETLAILAGGVRRAYHFRTSSKPNCFEYRYLIREDVPKAKQLINDL